jgi:hypothetical protein
MWVYLLKVVGWWSLAVVKFLLVPFFMIYSTREHWTWLETILISSSGAAGGVYLFFHLGEYLFSWWARQFGKSGRVMTRGRRFIIRVKWRWGLKGLLFISGLISVPLASLLAAKFYRHAKNTLPLVIIAFFVWSVVLTTIAYMSKLLFA